MSVSEFATPSAFLSMAVLEAGVKKIKESERGEADANSGSDSDDEDDDDRRELEIEVGHCLIKIAYVNNCKRYSSYNMRNEEIFVRICENLAGSIFCIEFLFFFYSFHFLGRDWRFNVHSFPARSAEISSRV